MSFAREEFKRDPDSNSHLRFLTSLDRINRVMQEATDPDQMLTQALEVLLSIFDCDRAWLIYPCDPNAKTWRVPVECTKPEWPGGNAANVDFPMDPQVAKSYADHLAANRPLKFGAGHEGVLPQPICDQYHVKSFISTAIFPKVDKPWLLGMHQCSHARYWSADDERLFQEIGRRLSDGLSSLLVYRDLLRSEAQYRCMVETASEGVWKMNAEGITTFVNAKLADMLGYEVNEIIGRPPSDFVAKEEQAHYAATNEKRLTTTQSQRYERRFLRKDGRIIWALASTTPIFDEKHNYVGCFGMFADITDLKRAASELVAAKEIAENVARMKSRFLDIAAHELRTPVTAMSLALELAHDRADQGLPLQADLRERLERQTKRLNRLVVDLLDVSRLDRGAMTLQRGEVHIVKLVRECVDEFRLQAPKRKLVFSSPAVVPTLDLDQVRIQQVVLNLIDNAIKYSPEDQPIEIKVETLTDFVRISVLDHGSGISVEDQAEIFKPFHRGKSDREVRASGLGLGLVVCDGIVKLHGGRVGVQSEVNVGSTFYFDLPIQGATG